MEEPQARQELCKPRQKHEPETVCATALVELTLGKRQTGICTDTDISLARVMSESQSELPISVESACIPPEPGLGGAVVSSALAL